MIMPTGAGLIITGAGLTIMAVGQRIRKRRSAYGDPWSVYHGAPACRAPFCSASSGRRATADGRFSTSDAAAPLVEGTLTPPPPATARGAWSRPGADAAPLVRN